MMSVDMSWHPPNNAHIDIVPDTDSTPGLDVIHRLTRDRPSYISAVPPRPEDPLTQLKDTTWALYDTSEAQDFKEKGAEWLQQTEKAVAAEHGLDMPACETVVTLLRTAVADIRMQYMQADQEECASRRLRSRIGTHLDKLKDLQAMAYNPEDLDHISFCHTHLASIVNNIEGRCRDNDEIQQRSKEHMFVLQQRIGGLAALSQSPACSICLCNPVTSVAIPCGHTYCSACSDKMMDGGGAATNPKCFICKSDVSFVNKMHIS